MAERYPPVSSLCGQAMPATVPNLKSTPQTPAAASGTAGMLSKSVFTLAIEPLTMALTVTGRKAYDVMLWLAQKAPAAPDGGYSSPVSTILKRYGSTTKASERVQRYIEQMVQTTVVWRPLATSEQTTLFGRDASERAAEAIGDEARTFPLLAEARLYIRAGEAWVTWYYPPSIREQLISPERWAQIELNSIARLSTYTAVALYEICARYKDSPGGLTSRQEPEFWTRVLREGGGLRPREFRKFKNELLMPAIVEINDSTEITIELAEHREQGTLHSVQFKVSRKTRPREQVPEPADVTLALHASRMGIREADLDALTLKHGASVVSDGLDAVESYVNDPNAKRITNRLAYLKAVLANRLSGEEGFVHTASTEGPRPLLSTDATEEREALSSAWKMNRLKHIKSEFAALPEDERARWIDEAAPAVANSSVMTPGLKRRFAERDWESPLISRIVLDVYASGRYGSGWKEPSEMDLVLFSVAESRMAP